VRTDNVFHMLNRFAAHEDQISAAFGVILQANPSALLTLLRLLRIPTATLRPLDWKQIDVETQVSYAGGEDEQSRIDLQIRLPGRFLVLIESKLGATRVGRNQLDKYAAILQDERDVYDHVRLALVTQFDRKTETAALAKTLRRRTGLKQGEFCYLRWDEVRHLVAESPSRPQTRFLNDLFFDYVGDMMSDKRMIKDQVIGKIHDVMIVATDADWWEVAVKKRLACQGNGTPDARYVAFYRTKPEAAITHIAEVEWTEKNVPNRETYRGFPKVMKKGKERGWDNSQGKVYHLKELIELPIHIQRRRGGSAIRVKMFTTISELLRARYIDDLFRKKEKRKPSEKQRGRAGASQRRRSQ
jgi:hypothetical protein